MGCGSVRTAFVTGSYSALNGYNMGSSTVSTYQPETRGHPESSARTRDSSQYKAQLESAVTAMGHFARTFASLDIFEASLSGVFRSFITCS